MEHQNKNKNITRFVNTTRKMKSWINYYLIKWNIFDYGNRWNKVNIGGGRIKIKDFANIDLSLSADIYFDLEKKLLPFLSSTIDTVICISTINYFSRERANDIITDTYRILKNGGVARFATQDLKSIAEKYVQGDKKFFFQKLANGKERFHGQTMADKINSWFYGYKTGRDKSCKYFYDFETLEMIFKEAGFSTVSEKKYMESNIPEIKEIDNRPDQMFFLEAIK